jgi:SOS-response transcriptional repressor LexA
VNPAKLTARQADILQYIRAHVAERGMPPSQRQIGAQFGIRSLNGVADHLTRLERKGHIERSLEHGAARNIRLVSSCAPPAERLLSESDQVMQAATKLSDHDLWSVTMQLLREFRDRMSGQKLRAIANG